MDFSTYLPLLLLLGLVVLPELSSGNSCSCNCSDNCSSCASTQCNTYRSDYTSGYDGCNTNVTSCSNCIDPSKARFKKSPEEYCSCQLMELQSLADNGYETWRLDPVAVAARFMQSCFIDECYRGQPAHLVGTCETCDKFYVVLGVGPCRRMIFELCQPVKRGECGIWIITAYAKYPV